jgi:hypothetical protein
MIRTVLGQLDAFESTIVRSFFIIKVGLVKLLGTDPLFDEILAIEEEVGYSS